MTRPTFEVLVSQIITVPYEIEIIPQHDNSLTLVCLAGFFSDGYTTSFEGMGVSWTLLKQQQSAGSLGSGSYMELWGAYRAQPGELAIDYPTDTGFGAQIFMIVTEWLGIPPTFDLAFQQLISGVTLDTQGGIQHAQLFFDGPSGPDNLYAGFIGWNSGGDIAEGEGQYQISEIITGNHNMQGSFSPIGVKVPATHPDQTQRLLEWIGSSSNLRMMIGFELGTSVTGKPFLRQRQRDI